MKFKMNWQNLLAFLCATALVVLLVRNASTVPVGFLQISAATLWGAFPSWAFPTSIMMVTKPIMNLASLGMVCAVEILVLGWKGCSLRCIVKSPSASLWADLLTYIFIITNTYWIFTYIVTLGWPSRYTWEIIHWTGGNLVKYLGPLPLQFILFIIVDTFYYYWMHRLLHEVDFLWSMHKFHHASDEFYIVGAHRRNPLSDAFAFATLAPISVAFGQPAGSFLEYVLIYTMLYDLQLHLLHSRLKWDFGWFGKYVILSPLHHRVHHSVNPEHYGGNYGDFLSLWDQLFRTYKDPVDVEKIGLPGYPTHNIVRAFIFDMRASLSQILGNLLLPWRIINSKSYDAKNPSS